MAGWCRCLHFPSRPHWTLPHSLPQAYGCCLRSPSSSRTLKRDNRSMRSRGESRRAREGDTIHESIEHTFQMRRCSAIVSAGPVISNVRPSPSAWACHLGRRVSTTTLTPTSGPCSPASSARRSSCCNMMVSSKSCSTGAETPRASTLRTSPHGIECARVVLTDHGNDEPPIDSI